MDSRELRAVLPVKEIVEIGNEPIGITHGSAEPWGIEQRIRKMFESDRIDIIVYGHPHRSQNKVIKDILSFNRGKATNPFGILTINGGGQGEIISFR
jgi:predicted phosphodiesterase